MITVKRDNVELDIEEREFKFYERQGFKKIFEDSIKENSIEELANTSTNVEEMNLKDLKALAKEKGFVGYSNLNKEQLVEMLESE